MYCGIQYGSSGILRMLSPVSGRKGVLMHVHREIVNPVLHKIDYVTHFFGSHHIPDHVHFLIVAEILSDHYGNAVFFRQVSVGHGLLDVRSQGFFTYDWLFGQSRHILGNQVILFYWHHYVKAVNILPLTHFPVVRVCISFFKAQPAGPHGGLFPVLITNCHNPILIRHLPVRRIVKPLKGHTGPDYTNPQCSHE